VKGENSKGKHIIWTQVKGEMIFFYYILFNYIYFWKYKRQKKNKIDFFDT